jgi:hypothetical protein
VLRRYKLRLGDGTTLLVDQDGLSTWLVDRKAMVQAGRSGKWIPLKEFLVHLRAAALREARQQAAAPKEREQTAEDEEQKRAAAREERRQEARREREQAAAREEREQPTDREERMRAAAREERMRAAAREERRQAAARGLTPPPTTTPPREDGLPLVPPPPRGDDLPSTPPPSARADGLPLVPPPPKDEAPLPSPPTPGDDAPLFIPQAPAEDAPVAPSPPEVEAPPAVASPEAEAPQSAPPPSEPESLLGLAASRPGSDAEVRITIGEPRLVDDVAPGRPAVPESPREDEPVGIGEPPGVQAFADEPTPAAHRSGSVSVDDVPVIPLKPLGGEQPGRPAEPPREDEPPSVMAGPAVQSLADDPGASPARQTSNTWTGATWDDEPPAIPLKPADEQEAAARRPARPRSRAASSFADDAPSGPIWTDGPAASVLRAVGSFGTFLSRCLDPLNRLEQGRPPFSFEMGPTRPIEPSRPGAPTAPPRSASRPPEIGPLAEEPTSVADEPRRPSTDDRLPLIPLKPLRDGVSELSTKARGLFVRVRSGLDGLTARASHLLRRESPPDSGPPERLVAADSPASLNAALEPRVVQRAPPALTEMPALRLKPLDEPGSEEEPYEEDLYGEDFLGERADFVSAIWVWTRRLVVVGVLLGLGTLAAMNRDVWLPQAADLGERTLSEIDEQVRSGHFARQQQRAVEEATRQLPHLAPETIRLIMVSSPIRVLDAPDVFEIAYDATDRGLAALDRGDAEELQALRQEMLATLRPEERERIREFDRARAQALAFPLDVRQAMLVYARAARALPPESRERLQALLGEAIAAGLTPATQLTPTASTERP